MFVKHRIFRLCLDKLLKIKTYQAIDSEFQFCKTVLKVVSMHFFFCINSESWPYVKLKFHKYLEKNFQANQVQLCRNCTTYLTLTDGMTHI